MIAFKTYNKKLLKKGEYFSKNCQETNTEKIFMNFEILSLKQVSESSGFFFSLMYCIDFTDILLFADILHCIFSDIIALINFTTDVT